MITGDSELLRMALENIIDNASKYTYENKAIQIKVQLLHNAVEIRIQDEGVGIPAEKISDLFEKFSRLDNPLSVIVGGTGVGLYWSKKVIELHRGSIAVTSKEGSGTTFIVTLPI
jgi:two-component system sensor histidine kinase SenX3